MTDREERDRFSVEIIIFSISRAIMTMDARDQFPVDMVEQMLKFTPSPEERALLDEHADEIDHLARADRFLFELSKYGRFIYRDVAA